MNETERLESVRRYDILDTPPDGSFDRITALAAGLFDVPIAIVSIVDEDRVWFKSCFGLDGVRQIPRDPGLCTSAICSPSVYVVESAHTDPRTLANPLVAGEFGLRFYAAAPLEMPDGFRLGTLCLIDRQTRQMSQTEQDVLKALAGVVVDEMELRLRAIRTVSNERRLRQEASQLAKAKEQLYQREHRVASSLQREMLPRAFPSLDDIAFDAVYVPAGAETVVGGDWYDAFVIDSNRLLISIGDVAGHGLKAAAVMGSLRQSLRALSLTERSPARLLRLLDEMLRSEYDDTMVTSFVAMIDLGSNMMHYANAGHPAPLLRLAGGELRELGGPGLPLGLRGAGEPPDCGVAVAPGSTLLLYTDGLTESTRNLVRGEQRLRSAFARERFALAPEPAHALCDELLSGTPADDVAIMTVSFA